MSNPRAAQRQPKGDDMKVLPFTLRAAQPGIETHVTGTRALKQAQVIGGLAGLVGGVVAGFFGAILTAASWFVINAGARHLFSTTGTVLLYMTIPLMIFGGKVASATITVAIQVVIILSIGRLAYDIPLPRNWLAKLPSKWCRC